MDFADVVADTARNNSIIQSALRDIDAETLAVALAGVDGAVRSAFLRNVSRRTRATLERDIEVRAGRAPPDRAEAAREHLAQLLRTHDERTPVEVLRPAPAEPPAVKLGTQRQIIETFRALAEHAQVYGPLSLEDIEPSVSDPFMGKALGFVVDGWDALDWRPIMEKRKQAYLHALEARLDMVLDGLESLQSGDSPRVVEERLSAYTVPS